MYGPNGGYGSGGGRCPFGNNRSAMQTGLQLLLSLLWFLVEVHSQTAPYMTFRGEILPNHGYVDLSLVGRPEDGGDSVECHTDLLTCCSNIEHPVRRGDWYFPSGVRLAFLDDSGDVYQLRLPQRVDLRRRNNATSPSGIYRCETPTVAVNDENDRYVREIVYVGVYGSGGDLVISGVVSMVVISNLNGVSPQFTLTCISTGGPATTVTWTRDSVTVTEGTETVLDDPVTAQYTHTLTVTGKLGGDYVCSVSNEVSADNSDSFTVTVASAPNNVRAVQENQTSIHLYWSPPSPLGDTTGYIISYTGGSSGSVTVSGGSIDNYLLTGLVMETRYTISIVATSEHFFSDSLEIDITLVSLPGQPSVSVSSITATSISLSWSVPSDSVVTSYEVMWRETDSGATEMTSGSLTDTSYTIEQLDSTTIYTITVAAANSAGISTDSLPIIISTGSDSCPVESIEDTMSCSDTDNTTAIIGGVVAIVLIMSITLAIIVIVVLVLRSRRGQYTTGPRKREAMPLPGATNTMELSAFSGEPTYVEPDVILTSSNEAYRVVSQTGEKADDYEVADPQTVLPQSPQLPTDGEYIEPV